MQIDLAATSAASTSMTDAQNARHQKLTRAAQQFEAVMLGELMKPMSKNSSIGSDDEESQSGPLQSFGVESMAAAMARSGALGFAGRIVNAVEAKQAKVSPQKSSESTQVLSQSGR